MEQVIEANVVELRAIAYKPSTTNGFASARPVFFLRFANGSELVLKGEARLQGDAGGETEQTLKWAGKLARGISDIKVQVCTRTELTEMANPGFSAHAADALHQTYFNTCMTQSLVWYKLPFLDALENLSIIEETSIALNKQNTRDIAARQAELSKTLKQIKKQSGFFKALGEVCAMDLFVGNTDRFTPTGTLVNVGNILWKSKSGMFSTTITPVALDFLDIGNSADGSNMSRSLATVHNWSGLTLINHGAIQQYATEVIRSLNGEIRQVMEDPDPNFNYFKPKYVTEIINGINSGTNTLRALLQTRSNNPNKPLPHGIRDRMINLGWLPGVVATPFVRSTAPHGPGLPAANALFGRRGN